jgi:hypothetical protein
LILERRPSLYLLETAYLVLVDEAKPVRRKMALIDRGAGVGLELTGSTTIKTTKATISFPVLKN